MIIGWRGQCVDDTQPVVSVYDHGFVYGLGLFETLRTYGGRPFLLKAHLQRLAKGLAALGIAYEPKQAGVELLIAKLLAANQLEDAYIRLTVTAGEEMLGLVGKDYEHPNEIIYVKPLLPVAPLASRPLQLLQLPRSSPEGPERFKSLHFLNNRLGKRELDRYAWAKGAEGLFLTASGYIAEGLVSNLFFVRGGVLFTPSVADTGILAGVTRQFVLELAYSASIPVAEGLYRWDDLLQAEEVFITNSVQEIVPIAPLYDTVGTAFWPLNSLACPVTRKLQQAYRSFTGKAL